MASATRVVCNEEGNDNGYKSNGNKGDGQATATRAMATAMVMAKVMMWVMVMVTRLAGDKKGKGAMVTTMRVARGQQREQGRQGNGDGDKGGGQANSNGNKEDNCGNDKIRGHRGRQRPTFAHHTTMTHDHGHDGINNNNWGIWTQQSTAGVL
jgi:hypothetical protein